MPPRGWKKHASKALTVNDFGESLELIKAARSVLWVLADKHDQMPSLLAALALVEQTQTTLSARYDALTVNKTADSPAPRSTDHPLVTQGVGLSAEQDGRNV